MTKNHDRKWLFVLGGPETQLHDILWAVHDGKNHGRSKGEENIGVFPVTVGCPATPPQSFHQASFMPPRCTLTGKEAMASRRAEFLAAHDHIQNGRQAVASHHAESVAARNLTPMWAEFEAAKAEWAVEQEAAKSAHRE